MKCLVIGGAGFIGSHVVDALVENGHQVTVFDLPNISLANLEQSIHQIEIIQGDFLNRNDLDRAITNIDIIIHLAYTTLPGPSNENPIYDVESNVVGTLNLLELAVKKKVDKIIFSSSGGTVYGIPEDLPTKETSPTIPLCSYGITKLTIERYLSLFNHLHNLDYTVLRISNPYGERQRSNAVQGAVAVFLGRVMANKPIHIWGDGSVARDYLYISDLSDAFIKAVENRTPSKTYNIGMGKAHTLNDIIDTIRLVTDITPKQIFSQGRKLDVPTNCLDVSLAEQELGWQPKFTLESGIRRMWTWMNRFHS